MKPASMLWIALASILPSISAFAQNRGGSVFPFTMLPPPSEEARALVRPCPKFPPGQIGLTEPLKLEPGLDPSDMQVRARRFNIIEWGRLHLKFQGTVPGCGSHNEILKVWQETFGPAVTGQFGRADMEQYDKEVAKAKGATQAADPAPRSSDNASASPGAIAGAGAPKPASQAAVLPAGSSWIGSVMCGSDKWDAAIRVDAKDAGSAELLASINQQTTTTRVKVSQRGQSQSFDLTPVDPADSGNPIGVVSGTVRTVEQEGVQRQIISWRPVDGAYPHCRATMRFSPNGVADLSPSSLQGITRIFGITINGPMEFPTCKVSVQQVRRCSPSGLSCWNESVRVQEQLPACFVPDKSHIQFDRQSQPSWANGPIGVRLDRQNRVVHLEFQAANGSAVLQELFNTFGQPARVDAKDRSQSAMATCLIISNVVDCTQTQQAREWKEYTQVWRSSSVEARFDEGSNRAVVTSLIAR